MTRRERRGGERELVTESLMEHISIFLIIPLDQSCERERPEVGGWLGKKGDRRKEREGDRAGEREESNSEGSDVPGSGHVHVIRLCVICAYECESACVWCVAGQEFRERDGCQGC